MEENVLRPQEKVKKYPNVIFLAGPIQGGPECPTRNGFIKSTNILINNIGEGQEMDVFKKR